MTKRNNSYRMLKLMLAMILGVFISAFSFGAPTAHAYDVTGEEYVIIEDEQIPLDESPEENSGGGAMILLLGGMLLIILVVVITVVATFVVTAPIADEI